MKNVEFKLIRTENFNTVQALCLDAQNRHLMVGLIGYTGAGKTTALKQYYQSTPNVYYVKCKNIMNRKQFFASVLKELGVNVGGTVFDMVNRIIDELNAKENPLLIIDDAGKLSHTLILDLHDLRDSTNENLGIILAGCEYFKENLKTAVKRDKQGVPEFYSRIVSWQILSKPSKREVSAIFEVNGIENNDVPQHRFSSFREIFNTISDLQFATNIEPVA
ncbi:MAG: ATP-binding protein [Prolixibacteraceae bacterium]|nr:ATP-binding protein [Prolixibacteraceae bacterium]